MRFSDIQKHLGSFSVGIAGAGGLGSNCAAALARSGIGTLVIADFDIVETLNLGRQFYFSDQVGMKKTEALKLNLLRINPGINVIMHAVRITEKNIKEIFSGCDVIVEAFDKAEMKEMLITTVQSGMPGVPLVVGSGMAGWGDTDSLKTRKIDDSLYVCGDETTEASEECPLMAPRVGIVSNMQANVVVDILINKYINQGRK